MAKKRKQGFQGHSSGSNKRIRSEAPANSTSGQRSVLPGLDEWDGPLKDGQQGGVASQEAIAYLQSVRSEAELLPNVLVAERAEHHHAQHQLSNTSRGGEGAYYSDGTYVAAPLVPHAHNGGFGEYANGHSYDDLDYQEEEEEETWNGRSAREAYDESLLLRFYTLREGLQHKPPDAALRSLDAETHPTSFEVSKEHPFCDRIDVWRDIMISTTPRPAQLAVMDQTSVLLMLEVLTVHMTLQQLSEEDRLRRLSAWAWGLLAKLDDLGTLSSEEVSVVRELGKRASSMVRSIGDARMAKQRWHEQVSPVKDFDDEYPCGTTEIGHISAGCGRLNGQTIEGLGNDEITVSDAECPHITRDMQEPKIDAVAQGALPSNTNLPRQRRRNSSSPPTSSKSLGSPQIAQPTLEVPGSELPNPSPRESSLEVVKAKSRLLRKISPAITGTNVDASLGCPNNDVQAGGKDESQGRPANTLCFGLPADRKNQVVTLEERDELDKAALASLDMIIAMAGIAYGQKDLLGVRERIWGVCGAEAATDEE